MGRTCRHLPSCSEYGIEALRRHGAWRGGWLTISRLSRCHPWGTHGFDPVPERLPDHGWCFWRYGSWSPARDHSLNERGRQGR
ncbi:membrane protein insertion efficiency factor YidD [Rhodoligotrophos ferricapiens]|uniref:membrane protein insertion efficiency factor YidD n=1 Tax=Rhodoligotrophos ferricapiens TaxID=3069264 RepID=UPI003D815F73